MKYMEHNKCCFKLRWLIPRECRTLLRSASRFSNYVT